MNLSNKLLKIFWQSLAAALLVVIVKYLLHSVGWEIIQQTSLHNSVVSSVTFVIGFLLSATIADYKESERIPAEVAAHLEDIYTDSSGIHKNYPVFDLNKLRLQLHKIAIGFKRDIRKRGYDARQDIRDLTPFFVAMEAGKVPPNFVVKLKQQQTLLLRSRHRVSYIQRIKFIPSATILARSIVVMLIVLLMLTNVDPFYGGLTIVGIITFVLVYMLILIRVISTPFHPSGSTQDDVSLFLINDAADYLDKPSK